MGSSPISSFRSLASVLVNSSASIANWRGGRQFDAIPGWMRFRSRSRRAVENRSARARSEAADSATPASREGGLGIPRRTFLYVSRV